MYKPTPPELLIYRKYFHDSSQDAHILNQFASFYSPSNPFPEQHQLVFAHLKKLAQQDPTLYLACPTYTLNGNIIDYQIWVSGSIHSNETSIQGVIREIGEEIGLYPSEGDEQQFIEIYPPTRQMHILSSYPDSLSITTPNDDSSSPSYYSRSRPRTEAWKSYSSSKRRTSKKVACLVVMTHAQVKEYLSKTISRIADKREHKSLKSITFIPIRTLLDDKLWQVVNVNYTHWS